jgi:uncharacterized surface protein with fasciclin (FAS1) repeats
MEQNMYRIYTTSKAFIATAVASFTLLFASPTIAGPGKPGINPIVPDGTIVDIALAVNDGGNGEFNGLLSAVLCFGPVEDNPIVDLLSGSDKYTLFAPVDDAFADLLARLSAIFETEITDPCQLDPDLLFTVLAYHVTDGRRFSNSVFNANNAKTIEMLAGGYVVSFVDSTDGPTLHDADGQMAGVVPDLFDINASNGVIHVIDTVVLPIDLPEID